MRYLPSMTALYNHVVADRRAELSFRARPQAMIVSVIENSTMALHIQALEYTILSFLSSPNYALDLGKDRFEDVLVAFFKFYAFGPKIEPDLFASLSDPVALLRSFAPVHRQISRLETHSSKRNYQRQPTGSGTLQKKRNSLRQPTAREKEDRRDHPRQRSYIGSAEQSAGSGCTSRCSIRSL